MRAKPGSESGALINGINGKRPVPPGRKVLATDLGVRNRPTLLSNASTFAQLAVPALLGPERFAAVGTPEEPGTVLLSVGGSAAQPAVIEVPTGIPLAAVLDLCQAPAGDGVLVGGYHGMWLPAETAYVVPVSREGLAAVGRVLGPGIVLPLGDGTCPLGEVSRIAGYLAGESTGQCGPCRLGLPDIARDLAAVVDGSGGLEALDKVKRSAAAPGRARCLLPPRRHDQVRALGRLTCSPRTSRRTSSTSPAAIPSGACYRCQPAPSRINNSGSLSTGRVVRAMGCVLNGCPS